VRTNITLHEREVDAVGNPSQLSLKVAEAKMGPPSPSSARAQVAQTGNSRSFASYISFYCTGFPPSKKVAGAYQPYTLAAPSES
jgi:hypothetical protein